MTLKKLLFAFLFKRAVKKAVKMQNQTGFKYMVININGKVRAASRSRLKDLIKEGRFKKGVTIEDIEKCALFKTY